MKLLLLREWVTTSKKLLVLLVAVFVSGIFLVGCGGRDDDDVTLTGTIEIDGSSTVYPISEAVAEEFNKLHGKVRVNVGVSGTGGGFKRFIIGETDISGASTAFIPTIL